MPTRDRFLKAGIELFHNDGIHSVGLDRILQQSGLTKTTFYKYFESIEHFLSEVIERYGQEVCRRLSLRVDGPQNRSVKEALLRSFCAGENKLDEYANYGRLLVGSGAVSSNSLDATRTAVVKSKQQLLDVYEQLAEQGGIKDAKRFAIRFCLLVEAALIARHLHGSNKQFEEARIMAEQLIDQALAQQCRPELTGH